MSKPTTEIRWSNLGVALIESDSAINITPMPKFSFSTLVTALTLLNVLGYWVFPSDLQLLAISLSVAFMIFYYFLIRKPKLPIIRFDKNHQTLSINPSSDIFNKAEIDFAEVRYINEPMGRRAVELSIFMNKQKKRVIILDWRSGRDDAFGVAPSQDIIDLGKAFFDQVGIELKLKPL